MRQAVQGVLFPHVIDVLRLIDWRPVQDGQLWRVGGVGRRGQEVGRCVGILGLRHAGGYEVVLEFGPGEIETFRPHDLFPVAAA